MTPPVTAPQHIARLTPLSEVYAAVDRIAAPTKPRWIDVAEAAGRILATDVSVKADLPAKPTAVRDGWAVSSDLVADAGPYAPVPLQQVAWVENGQQLPADADAVLSFDGLLTSGTVCEAIAPASPGEGVMLAGADTAPGRPLRRAGELLRAIDIGALRGAGVTRVEVRNPIVTVVTANPAIDETSDAVAPLIASALKAAGATAQIVRMRSARGSLEQTLSTDTADALITIGGTGIGCRDSTVKTVSQAGTVAMHGMAIGPGETTAFGQVFAKPVLMLPGRLDAALAAWLLVGSRLVQRLSGSTAREIVGSGSLARKITSTVGITEVVLVRRGENSIQPLAAKHFPLQSITRADGWLLVPPDSEGFAPGTSVQFRLLP